MLAPAPNANDEPFDVEPAAAFEAAPGREVAWWPGVLHGLEAFFEGRRDASSSAAQRLGPGHQRVVYVDASVLPRLAEIDEPLRDFAERVCRCRSDVAHANEHGEEMKLTPAEYKELPLATIRARTTRLEDIPPFHRAQLQARFDAWHAALEELIAFEPRLEPGQEIFCVVWQAPD